MKVIFSHSEKFDRHRADLVRRVEEALERALEGVSDEQASDLAWGSVHLCSLSGRSVTVRLRPRGS